MRPRGGIFYPLNVFEMQMSRPILLKYAHFRLIDEINMGGIVNQPKVKNYLQT